MLTLTETVDAIRALDTDADVIRGACRSLLADPKNFDNDLGPSWGLFQVAAGMVDSREALIDLLIETLVLSAISLSEPDQIAKAAREVPRDVAAMFGEHMKAARRAGIWG